MIQQVHRDYIHEEKWNALLIKYGQKHPYATLHYLNAVCKNWSALVFGDYEAILPFCWNKKWNVKYIFQPPFLQQMMYVGPAISQARKEKILQILYAQFSFIEYKVNIPLSDHTKKNYVLDLNKSYESLRNNYSGQTKKNLKSSLNYITEEIPVTEFVEFYKRNTVPKIPNWKKEFTHAQLNLLHALRVRNELKIIGTAHEGNFVAMTALAHTEGNLVHLMPSTSALGRDLHGTSILLDHLIQKYANTKYILDFEGSEIEGIAKFNEGFGAVLQPYYELKSNKLTFPFNLFKK